MLVLNAALGLSVAFPDLLMSGFKRREVRATKRLGQPAQGMLGYLGVQGARAVGVIMLQPLAVILDALGCPVSGGGNGTALREIICAEK